MKTGKLFTIDVEIAEKLTNLNASKLVNELLKEYFQYRTGKNSLKEQKQAILKEIFKKKSKFLQKFGHMRNGTSSRLTGSRKSGSLLEGESPPRLKSRLILMKEKCRRIFKSWKKLHNSTKNTETCSNEN